jgi:nicotinamidase-related amidase
MTTGCESTDPGRREREAGARFSAERAALVVVDVQGKLATLMHERESLYANLRQLAAGAKALGVPILWLEQNPERMGRTIPELQEILKDAQPIPKMTFSGCGEPRFLDALAKTGRRQVILCGIETHVCVFQTAADLIEAGYAVQVVAEAVSSRSEQNRRIGLERIRAAGGTLTSVEMLLFELLGTAAHPAFREVLRLVR